MVGARLNDKKTGADRGIDGRLMFHDDLRPGNTKQIILSVKSGKIPANHIRELRGVVDREDAQFGVLLTLESPTKPMITEAADAGFYTSPTLKKHPKIQIITIEELINGKAIDYPETRANVTYKRAERYRPPGAQQRGFAEVIEATPDPATFPVGTKGFRAGPPTPKPKRGRPRKPKPILEGVPIYPSKKKSDL